ncbi:DUF6215 domain-containing protein [Streptomyces sp. NPDC091268]|uniref:DUF6215 domain-containing protein n=1 Tax=Streptomyces sp. NPDC091268 TaxID=3365979 RepID=UPI0037F19E88
MSDEVTVSGALGQAVTAVVLVGGLVAGLWTVAHTSAASGADAPPPPAVCVTGKPTGMRDGERGSGPATGKQVCEALHRPDLADLLGTPGEAVKSAGGSDDTRTSAEGRQIARSSARVELPMYTVTLSAATEGLPVSTYASLLGTGARRATVLERPAVFFTDRTLNISFRLDGSDSKSGPGVLVRVLTVAGDARDGGGGYELALWRTDGALPDDAVVLRLAEAVLPTLPGWSPAA